MLAGTHAPAGSLVADLPARVRRELTQEETDDPRITGDAYVALARRHASDLER